MSSWTPKLMPAGEGMNSYAPPLSNGALQFERLQHVCPRNGRLVTPKGYEFWHGPIALAPVLGLAKLTIERTQATDLYAITDTDVYHIDVSDPLLESPVWLALPSDGFPPAWAEWYDRVFLSKRGGKLLSIKAGVATVVAGGPAARYLAISQGHLVAANYRDDSTDRPNGVRWSDYNEPTSFGFATDSEADLYDLEPGYGEITGLSSHRGNNLIYTRNSIWLMRYFPFPTGYRFEPLYVGIGCRYHYSQISYRNMDYFVGEDNFYRVDGYQVIPIGDAIWDYFIENNTNTGRNAYVKAFADPETDEVWWSYDNLSAAKEAVVYNSKEEKWSVRSPLNVASTLYFNAPIRGYTVIDDYTTGTINGDARQIDGDFQYVETDEQHFFGTFDGDIAVRNNVRFTDHNGLAVASYAETFDFFFDSISEQKEVDELTLAYKTVGGTDISLEIGRRDVLDDAISWSSPVAMSNMIDGQKTFFFRNSGVGRYIRFKLSWTNQAASAVKEISLIEVKLKREDADSEIN